MSPSTCWSQLLKENLLGWHPQLDLFHYLFNPQTQKLKTWAWELMILPFFPFSLVDFFLHSSIIFHFPASFFCFLSPPLPDSLVNECAWEKHIKKKEVYTHNVFTGFIFLAQLTSGSVFLMNTRWFAGAVCQILLLVTPKLLRWQSWCKITLPHAVALQHLRGSCPCTAPSSI